MLRIACTMLRRAPVATTAVASFASASSSMMRFANNGSAQQQAVRTAAAAAVAVPVFTLRFESVKQPGPENPKKHGAYLLDKSDVLARVLEVVKNFEKVDASKVTPESHFINDLGLDSLDVVEVVMALEQEFVLDIPDHEAEKIQSVPDAVDYLASNPMAK